MPIDYCFGNSAEFWKRTWPTWTSLAKWRQSTSPNEFHRSAHEKVFRWPHSCDGTLANPSAFRFRTLSSLFFFFLDRSPKRKNQIRIRCPQFSPWCSWGICFAFRGILRGLSRRCRQFARLLERLPGRFPKAYDSGAGSEPQQECWLHSLLCLAPTSLFSVTNGRLNDSEHFIYEKFAKSIDHPDEVMKSMHWETTTCSWCGHLILHRFWRTQWLVGFQSLSYLLLGMLWQSLGWTSLWKLSLDTLSLLSTLSHDLAWRFAIWMPNKTSQWLG